MSKMADVLIGENERLVKDYFENWAEYDDFVSGIAVRLIHEMDNRTFKDYNEVESRARQLIRKRLGFIKYYWIVSTNRLGIEQTVLDVTIGINIRVDLRRRCK